MKINVHQTANLYIIQMCDFLWPLRYEENGGRREGQTEETD